MVVFKLWLEWVPQKQWTLRDKKKKISFSIARDSQRGTPIVDS